MARKANPERFLRNVRELQAEGLGVRDDDVAMAISWLDDDLRFVVEGTIAGMSQAAMAAEACVERSTIAKRLKRARNQLQSLIPHAVEHRAQMEQARRDPPRF